MQAVAANDFNSVTVFAISSNCLCVAANDASLTEESIRSTHPSEPAAGLGRRVWVTRSVDAGASWAVPTEITHMAKRASWTWCVDRFTRRGGAAPLPTHRKLPLHVLLIDRRPPLFHRYATGPAGAIGTSNGSIVVPCSPMSDVPSSEMYMAIIR